MPRACRQLGRTGARMRRAPLAKKKRSSACRALVRQSRQGCLEPADNHTDGNREQDHAH
jgi:hypothetical protein